jgi:hypothetical protein
MEQVVGTVRACAILGRSRATLHRHRNPAPARLGPRRPFLHPAELTDAEREQVLAVLDSSRFADKSPGQVWAVLLDEGVYLCSQATMYRLLRERGQAGERRAHAIHPAKKKPELEADGPNQVWSWDITKLKGPVRGVYYLLYVIIDIFSRKVIWWEIWPTENGALAKEFLQNAIAANGGRAPGSVHADRGVASSDVPNIANTGLIAERTSEVNQPFTAWSILHATSNSPHLPEPVSRLDGAGLDGAGVDDSALGVGDAELDDRGREVPELDGVGVGVDPAGVGVGAAAAIIGVGVWSAYARASTSATARTAMLMAQQQTTIVAQVRKQEGIWLTHSPAL